MVSKKSNPPEDAAQAEAAAPREGTRAYRPSAKLAGRRGSGPLLGPLAGRVSDEGPSAVATPAPVGSIQDVMAALRVTAEDEAAKV